MSGPFKMKGSPMQKNFGIGGSPLTKKTDPQPPPQGPNPEKSPKTPPPENPNKGKGTLWKQMNK